MERRAYRLPRWMKVKLPMGENYSRVKNIVSENKLHTICTSGNCPNIGECWGNGTATFMILGDICTRSCKFCDVKTGKPNAIDTDEPQRLAETIQTMNVRHAVITSVDRDDLADGGANAWAAVIRAVKEANPNITMEVLIPDFDAKPALLQLIIDAKPDVISHNLETVERITPLVRSRAQYRRSLDVIRHIAASGIVAKSGIMLGLGETEEEIFQTMDDLISVGCQVMTIGQYLQPSDNHYPITEFITPEKFELYHKIGIEKGFKFVESSPLVRSSYHAEKHVKCNG